MAQERYYELMAQQLARKIVPGEEIKPFVGNDPNLVGAFAEEQVREFVRATVSPLQVSHGAVIRAESHGSGERLKQLDTIIWTPNPLPALFQVGEFALVPWENSMGVLEIKSSDYKLEVVEKIEDLSAMTYELTCGRPRPEERGIVSVLGVIVLNRHQISATALKPLVDQEKAVVLMDWKDEKPQVDDEALLTFVNFLAGIRSRAHQLSNVRIQPKTKQRYPDDSRTSI